MQEIKLNSSLLRRTTTLLGFPCACGKGMPLMFSCAVSIIKFRRARISLTLTYATMRPFNGASMRASKKYITDASLKEQSYTAVANWREHTPSLNVTMPF
jgi:hypothetical protein